MLRLQERVKVAEVLAEELQLRVTDTQERVLCLDSNGRFWYVFLFSFFTFFFFFFWGGGGVRHETPPKSQDN